jgi:hypothetical protein
MNRHAYRRKSLLRELAEYVAFLFVCGVAILLLALDGVRP